ncbi:prephenate dehydratase [Fusibacter paucivorans]|uniref:Prephenate dehydratase n=1 Tax=Fusibacter paucivorans TaxID=76009 RepID=A0ABS5PSJ8_9FIRM|nr:prephenate dehydratase [Fusibacter paucivorans]MBS7528140.1 prephenate dehydratase [Fusibacter paucivorans]
MQIYDKTYALQGTEGSYSYEALIKYHGGSIEADYNCFDTFEEVFETVISGKARYGILPIENSSTGSITTVFDLLNQHTVNIVGEVTLRITHHLVAPVMTDVANIQTVYSHIQGFEQSKNFFKAHPHLNFIPYKNTALSAKRVSESGREDEAAVASRLAAEIHKLHIIEENINDQNNNFTRFIIISLEDGQTEASDKISIVSVVDHTPGSLYKMLSCFENAHLNLLKIESRPLRGRPWEYSFYIDFEGNLNDENVKRAVDELKYNARTFKILGNYCSGEGK